MPDGGGHTAVGEIMEISTFGAHVAGDAWMKFSC